MHLITKNMLLLFMFILTITSGNAVEGNNGLTYLKNNFNHLYHTNYKLFFNILIKTRNNIMTNHDYRDIASFFEVIFYVKVNAEVQEYFDEEIMNICIEKPIACFKAIQLLSKETRDILFRFYLPSGTYPSDKLDVIFIKYINHPKYKYIVKRYFSVYTQKMIEDIKILSKLPKNN